MKTVSKLEIILEKIITKLDNITKHYIKHGINYWIIVFIKTKLGLSFVTEIFWSKFSKLI